jgi:ParB-like chromosome segregation protein Spo0J
MKPVAVEAVVIGLLRPHPRNARVHSREQLYRIADSIRTFGFNNPVLASDDNEIVAGCARVEAAKLLGLTHIPVVRLSHLNGRQRRAYMLADNKLAEHSTWDRKRLVDELTAVRDFGVDVEITGFSLPELRVLTGDATPAPRRRSARKGERAASELWRLGPNRLLCLMEFDPAHEEEVVRRFERLAGTTAQQAGSGQSFTFVADAAEADLATGAAAEEDAR